MSMTRVTSAAAASSLGLICSCGLSSGCTRITVPGPDRPVQNGIGSPRVILATRSMITLPLPIPPSPNHPTTSPRGQNPGHSGSAGSGSM